MTVLSAAFFQQAVRLADKDSKAQIEERDLLLHEVEHRMRNNFAIVLGMIDLERRAAQEPAKSALTRVMARVESIARAHRSLYLQGDSQSVRMRDYLGGLCEAFAETLTLRGAVTLHCEIADVLMDRDSAVLVGLVANELVTNAAKHAFAGKDGGAIEVRFTQTDFGFDLHVSDNGVGLRSNAAEIPSGEGGLGRRLIDAFVRQAKAKLQTDADATGTRILVSFPVR